MELELEERTQIARDEHTRTVSVPRDQGQQQDVASFSAKQIIGSSVYDNKDRELGTIHDIMISTNGRVAYIVLSYGGVFGTTLGDKRFAIPFQAFSMRQHDADVEFTLSVDKNILENAPGFDKDTMPNFADPTFANRIDKYYKEYSPRTVQL